MPLYKNLPMVVLKEGTEQKRGKKAFENNMAAAMAIAEAVRSTLGPKGLDKLLIDGLGDLTITNDGATILKEIDVKHPTAKMMVSVAETQDDEVGDGTTTSVILAGNILKSIGELIHSGVHPSIVAKGIYAAKNKALEILDAIAQELDESDRDMMKKVVSTSMNSKLISLGKDRLSDIALDAMLALKKAGIKALKRNVDKIKIVKKEGGDALEDTKLIHGFVSDKEIVHSQMPRRVDQPKIAILGFALEAKKGEWDAKISIKSPENIASFLDEEERMAEKKIDSLVSLGVNAVISSKSMDDTAIHFLKKAGIMAIKSVSTSDIKLIAEATGASILNSLDDATPDDLGSCKVIEEKPVADSKFIFIEGCENPQALTILIRGEGGKSLDEVERGLHDALCIASKILEHPHIVAGGGAVEVEISKQLNEFAKTFTGREQLVIERFATALESIPLTLAENAGIDGIEALSAIRSSHVNEGDYFKGYNLYTNKVEDMRDAGVVEPVDLMKVAVRTAAEVAMMIVRIDDVIRAGNLSD
ncbi:thermosome subunit [Candidatus Bathyarchaeota archaeon]|nr:thermosome subunit [Candidatus Bathyarchaeota archaeon]